MYIEISLIVLGVLVSLVLGANNASTCFGPSIGLAKYSEAACLAILGVFLGVLAEGAKLSGAISGGVLYQTELEWSTILAMMISLVIVLALATSFSLPLPLSEGIVGSAVGIGLAKGLQVNWNYTLKIVAFWVLTPFLAAVLAVLIYRAIVFFTGKASNILTLNYLYGRASLALSFYVAYVLGANTLGLISGVYQPLMGYFGPVLFASISGVGIYLFGRGITESVGRNIISLSPSTALVAQLSGAITVHLLTELSLPVSITQAIVGGVLGVGLAKKIVMLNTKAARNIVVGWTVAPVSGALIAYLLARTVEGFL